jgi:hypothetical protein
MPMAVEAVGEVGEAVEEGTIGGGRDAQDLMILVEGGKGPPWSLRYM